jgi:MPBQ/MSBQ methyltransferase
VANSYDQWTQDGILEFYWGEHIHLGHYGSPPQQKDFLQAKEDFVHEMVHWGGLDALPGGTTVLDVGCGIGGSSRILARDYGFSVTGVTISPQQVQRAQELTPEGVDAQFRVDDALALSFPDASFDVVWSIEAGPHMPDKAQYAREMMRVLKPGGTLVVADWNQRDERQQPLNFWEKPVMRQLLDQWSHPAFSSIEGFSELLAETGLVEGEVVTADWTQETLPSWLDSIWLGIIRPQGFVRFGLPGFVKSVREVPTLLLMRLAFGAGLCRFGMFRAQRASSLPQSTATDRNEVVSTSTVRKD